ncbi:hypothetical protein ONZ45_g6926 [Pleurotus djamor]|nr:hypothetical protein ONZ45_g6926 [Pleurotus djamor]
MYDIALPILYGHITIEGTSPYYDGLYGELQTNPMYTRCGNLPSNHEHLTLTKEFILKIGRESLLDKVSAHYELSTVIASMPNLKKLHMSLPSTPDIILKTIPSDNCFRLTHLSLISGVTSATTLRVLVAQPTLQYVDLGAAVFQDLPLPSFALPCLQTFIGDSGLWDVFVNKGQRPVKHLVGRIHHTTSFRHPHETFRNIKTLKIDFPNAAKFRLMSPYLESIEYLNLRAYGREVCSIFYGVLATHFPILTTAKAEREGSVLHPFILPPLHLRQQSIRQQSHSPQKHAIQRFPQPESG